MRLPSERRRAGALKVGAFAQHLHGIGRAWLIGHTRLIRPTIKKAQRLSAGPSPEQSKWVDLLLVRTCGRSSP